MALGVECTPAVISGVVRQWVTCRRFSAAEQERMRAQLGLHHSTQAPQAAYFQDALAAQTRPRILWCAVQAHLALSGQLGA